MRIDPTSPAGRAERILLGRAGTMRDPARAPIDVLIENLSETGALLRTEADLPTGTLVSLGVAGAGMQFARVVRAEPHGVAIAFMVPLEPEKVAQAKTVRTLVAVAIPQIERPVPDAPGMMPAGIEDDAISRLPVRPLPTPADPLPPMTYGATGTVEAAKPATTEPPAPDARALWTPAPPSTRRTLPSRGAWLIVAAVLAAALVFLLL